MGLRHRMLAGSFGLLAVAFLISCSSSKPPISVAVSAPASQTDQGLTIIITSSVTNDSSAQGVKWSLTGPGSLLSTAGVSVTYTAPPFSNIKTVQSATVTATSVSDPSKSASLQISVNPLPNLPFGALPIANAGVSYSQALAISGGTPPFAWVIGNGTVPAGLSFNTSTGTISGTPTQGGTWWFDVQATDAAGVAKFGVFDLEVQQKISGTNPIPFLTQPLVPSSRAPGGPAFTLTVNGTGFLSTSTIDFDGAALTTTFVNQGQLQATVPATSIASSSTHSITVVSPAPGGGSSNIIYFPVAPPEAAPSFALAPGLPIVPALGLLESVATADFNHDGKTDLAIAYDVNLAVLLGNGDGTFAIASGSPFLNPSPPFNNAPGILQTVTGLIASDFFNGGNPGLAAVGFQNQNVAVFNGNGNGTLTLSPTAVWSHGSPTVLPVAADFNGDGNLDLLVGNSFAGPPVVALLGFGNGAFNQQPFPTLGISAGVAALAVGDFNGDGKLDFAVCLGVGSSAAGVEVFLGNGDGSFAQVPGTMESGIETAGIVVADFNGDGKLDLAFVAADTNHSSVNIMLGNGDGTFVPAPGSPIQMPGFQPVLILVGDFLNQGKLDLVVTGEPQLGNNLIVLPGNGDGTFQSAIRLNVSAGTNQDALGDFNGSGRLGFASGNLAGGPITVVIQP